MKRLLFSQATACLLFLPLVSKAAGIHLNPVPASSQAHNQITETTIAIDEYVITLTGKTGIGYLDGNSPSMIYDSEGEQLLSELEWDLDGNSVANVGGSLSFNDWLAFNADVHFKSNKRNGATDEFDWFVTNYDWTHWSHHDDNNLTKAYMIDLNAALIFQRRLESDFFALIGYKRDEWEWQGQGGSNVSSSFSGYNVAGAFSGDELGRTYNQWYDVPYLGLGFTSKSSKWGFMGKLIYSPMVFVGAEDNSQKRHLVVEDDFETTSMWAVDVGGSYFFSEKCSLWLTYHYQRYEEARGNSTITNTLTGQVDQLEGDVAGTNNEASVVSLLFSIDF